MNWLGSHGSSGAGAVVGPPKCPFAVLVKNFDFPYSSSPSNKHGMFDTNAFCARRRRIFMLVEGKERSGEEVRTKQRILCCCPCFPPFTGKDRCVGQSLALVGNKKAKRCWKLWWDWFPWYSVDLGCVDICVWLDSTPTMYPKITRFNTPVAVSDTLEKRSTWLGEIFMARRAKKV